MDWLLTLLEATGLCPPSTTSVLVLGIDDAGKTAMTLALARRVYVAPDGGCQTTPTTNTLTQTLTRNCRRLVFNDVGGHVQYRATWPNLYHGADVFLFLVDSSPKGRERAAEVKRAMKGALEVRGDRPILVVFTKWDIGQTVGGIEDLRAHFEIPDDVDAIPASATSPEGLNDVRLALFALSPPGAAARGDGE
jgi:GTPase SAR1 family protein